MAGGAGLEALPMRGEFTAARDSKVRYALVLTERELSVQRLADNRSTGARAITVFDLDDCIGCSVHGTEGEADPGASFSVYLYPVRSRCALTSPPSRRRVERRFRVMQSPDPRSNLEEAHRWARAIREGSIRNGRSGAVVGEVRRPCRFLLLINPQSGKGQALSLFTRHVQSMLQEACITYTLIVTEYQNHAREMVREADLSQWDALVIMSGDGLLFEVVNGLMEREDWEQAIQTPLGVLPGGSGNALAASMHYYTGSQLVSDEDLLVNSSFMLCKGLVSRMDLISICMASSQRLFSFQSFAWGFVADVDIESEKYRHIGKLRFTMGTLARILSLRVYRGKLSYLPAEESQTPTTLLSEGPVSVGSSSDRSDNHSRICQNHTLHNSCNSNNTLKSKCGVDPPPPTRGPPDSLLVPLDQPVPAHWTVVKEEEFILVLVMYQSHLAEDLIAAPASRLDDGVMHLIYVRAGISRLALLRLFLAMAKGTHFSINCPFVVYVKARALRLEPHTPNGMMTVDGEQVEYGPVQAQIYGSLARVIAR